MYSLMKSCKESTKISSGNYLKLKIKARRIQKLTDAMELIQFC